MQARQAREWSVEGDARRRVPQPAPSDAPSPPLRTVLELQGQAGNTAVVRMLQRVKYKSTAPQGCEAQLDTGAAGTTVVSVAFLSGYHGPQPHIARGDHGTAMVTFLHMVENAVRGVDHVTAIRQLRAVALGLASMPGMQAPRAAQPSEAALHSVEMLLKTAEQKAPGWASIAAAMDMLIVARNMVPLSAITHSTSTKGGGEGAKAGDLQYGEKKLAKAGDTDYVLQPADMAKIWGLCEMRKRPVSGTEPVLVAAYLQQHLYSMRLTYPHLVGPDDYGKLISYAFGHLWSESTGTAYQGFDGEKDQIEKILRKAMEAPEAIQYVKNPSKRWSKEIVKGIKEFY